jgi:hypothetical protein
MALFSAKSSKMVKKPPIYCHNLLQYETIQIHISLRPLRLKKYLFHCNKYPEKNRWPSGASSTELGFLKRSIFSINMSPCLPPQSGRPYGVG